MIKRLKPVISMWLGFMLLTATAFAGVNINTANVQELSSLHGIGPAKAQAIVNYRHQHGPFPSVDELARVKGIGAKTVQKLKDEISIN